MAPLLIIYVEFYEIQANKSKWSIFYAALHFFSFPLSFSVKEVGVVETVAAAPAPTTSQDPLNFNA